MEDKLEVGLNVALHLVSTDSEPARENTHFSRFGGETDAAVIMSCIM